MNPPAMTMSIEAVDFVTTQLDEPVRQFSLDLLLLFNHVDAAIVGVAAEDKTDESPSASASARVDRFEIAVRTAALHCMSCCSTNINRMDETETERKSETAVVTELQQLLNQVVAAVCHILYFAERDNNTVPQHKQEQEQEQEQQKCYTSLKEVASQLRKVPVTLLEDILDTLSLSSGYEVWKACCSSSSYTSMLFFGPILWDPSVSSASKSKQLQPPIWLPFLKCANKFLRRLQAQQSLPLRSTTTTTTTTTTNNSGQGDSAAMAAADVLQILSRVYPLSEKSATRMWGSHNTDHLAEVGSEADFAREQQPQNEKISAQSTTTATTTSADYSLYETFWTLQHDFRNPNSVVVADFLHRLKTVVRTFQSHAPAEAVQATDSESAQQQQQQLEQQFHLLIQPYLTHSRLLTIQLTDPMLRAVILLQFQMVAQHLTSQVPPLRVQLQPHLDAARQQLELVLPHQQELVQAILERSEPQWRTWKQNKCQPDLEVPVMQKRLENGTAHVSTAVTTANKRRKRSPQLSRGTEKDDKAAADAAEDEQESYAWNATTTTSLAGNSSDDDDSHNHLQSVAHALRAAVPSTTSHLEDYVDALDPDAGIEPEYHPKNDAVYGWRALRLLAQSHLADFADGVNPDGDFEPLVRTMYRRDHAVDIPGTGPELYQEPESSADEKDEKDDIRMEDGAKQHPDDGEDDVMDDTQPFGETDDDDIGIGEPDDEEEIVLATAVEQIVPDENGIGESVADPMDAEEESHQRNTKQHNHKIDDQNDRDSTLIEERDNGEKTTRKTSQMEPNGDAGLVSSSKDEKKTDAFSDNSKSSRSPSASHQPVDAPHDSRKPAPAPGAAAPSQSHKPAPPAAAAAPPSQNRSDLGGYSRSARPGSNAPRPLPNSDYRRDNRSLHEDHHPHHPPNPPPRGRSLDDRGDRSGGGGGGGGGGDRGGGDDRVGGRPDDRLYRDRERDSGVGREGVSHRGPARDYIRRDDSRGRRGGVSGRGDRNRR